MNASTKKMLYYGGGALLVGAVGFFVYSFFKKEDAIVIQEDGNDKPNSGGFVNPNVEFAPIEFTQSSIKEMWNKYTK
jgi:hypothetical protein